MGYEEFHHLSTALPFQANPEITFFKELEMGFTIIWFSTAWKNPN